ARLRARLTQTKIPQILDDDGNKHIDPQAISNAFAAFYSKLYNLHTDTMIPHPQSLDAANYLEDITLPKVSDDHLRALLQPITVPEITHTIKQLPLRKSPGADGLSNAYYKEFSDLLAPQLLKLYRQTATS
ncbi:DUF1725 domain-containing, partial [Pelobates cultripes]